MKSAANQARRRQSKKIRALAGVNRSNIPKILHSIQTHDDVEALIASGAITLLSQDSQAELVRHIDKIPHTKSLKPMIDFAYWASNQISHEYCEAINALGSASVEQALQYLEDALMRMSQLNISTDNKKYPDHIIDSQYEHLLSTLGSAIYLFSKRNVQFSIKQREEENIVPVFWDRMAHYESMRSFMLEVENGSYLPLSMSALSPTASAMKLNKIIGKAKYFMCWTDPTWRQLEIYRDLNYQFNNHYEDDITTINYLLRKSEAADFSTDNSYLRIDFSKKNQFALELQRYKIEQLISIIYGSTEAEFEYNGVKLQISKLIDVNIKILSFANDLLIKNKTLIKKQREAVILSLTLQQILKIADLDKKDSHIIGLISNDIYNGNITMDVPLLKFNETYCIIPSHIVSLSYEKVVDKILSRRDITLHINSKKGHIFEEEMLNLLHNKGLKAIRINGDSRKGTPEFDAVLELPDGNIIIAEMKCSIKPECRRDAYSFIENHIEPALTQLDARHKYVIEHPAEMKKLGIDTENKTISLIIITNHHYFSGASFKTPAGLEAFIIDSMHLVNMISRNTVPQWHYKQQTKTYVRNEKYVKQSCYLHEMKFPSHNLITQEKKTIQIQKSGIGIYIYSNPDIDQDSYYGEDLRKRLANAEKFQYNHDS